MTQQPRLIAVSGPVKGRAFALADGGCTIGRHGDNGLQVLDLALSRRHCALAVDADGRWLLRDLGSSAGTFLNGKPIREHPLEHGDLLQVGGTTFVFLLFEHVETQVPAGGAEGSLLGNSTVERKLEDSALLHPGDQRATELGALVRLSLALHGARGVEAVAAALVEGLLAALPAERACVLLARDGPEPLEVMVARTRSATGHAPFPVSRTVVQRALERRAAVLCADVAQEPTLGAAESVDISRARSLLCAPLLGRQRVLGALYLDARAAQALTEPHLELATAAAAIASLALEGAAYVDWLKGENQRLHAERAEHGLVGESPAMKRLHALVQRAAPSNATVLLRGESGTGKELCARALHAASPRAAGPFVAINCATLSETLLESELFGHERGAFTGAVARKLGKVELAHQGTLFLDEIGELPVALQAKLLRVLQEREVDRVGGAKPIPVDVRVVAATHLDLEAAIRERRFREDLFYRLNVVTLALPPLRERPEDIPLLALHFARAYAEHAGRPPVGLSDEAREALLAYDWPGNVRQLGNAIERALVLGAEEVIRREDLPDEVLAARTPPPAADGAPGGTIEDKVLASKRQLIVEAFAKAGGDHQTAAGLLGIHPNSLHRLLRNLGLRTALGK